MSIVAPDSSSPSNRKKIRIPTILKSKGKRKITCLTCYDATFAAALDTTDLDIVLVGDSLGHVIQGNDSTISVKISHMCYHTACVAKNIRHSLLVADLPFSSCGLLKTKTLKDAAALMQHGAHAVKIEGASPEVLKVVKTLTQNGIPVMGHLGFTPQSLHQLGGYKIHRQDAESLLLQSSIALQEAGCFAIVLELLDPQLAAKLTAQLAIPTIGIGAGSNCDGQVLVLYDLLGMNPEFHPKFLKKYRNFFNEITNAVKEFTEDVRESRYPVSDAEGVQS